MAKQEEFESPYARLFYLLNKMMQLELISSNEKAQLKDLIIQNDQRIQILLELEDYGDLNNRIFEIINDMRVCLQSTTDFEDDDSTTKSLRQYLIKKLRLDLKVSNFKLGLKKRV